MSTVKRARSTASARCVWALVLAFGLVPVAQAQAPTPQQLQDIQRQQDRIQQQEQLRRQEQLREQDPARRPPSGVDPALRRPGAQPAVPSTCSQVDAIRLEGAERLSAQEQATLTAPFVGRCMGLKEIGELMRAITNRYIALGLVTTRVYIPQQDLGRGTLRLLVLEGKVGEVKLSDPQSRVHLASAFPGVRGQVLNIRDIEQGLDQINRLRSNNAAMELQPSTAPGLTNILITNQAGRPWSTSLALDNYGTESTGDIRATGTLGLDNVLGLNDAWFVSLSRNTDAHPGERLSESALASVNLPYGYWNFLAAAASSRYATVVHSLTQSFHSTGETDTVNLGLQRVLMRGQTSKLTLNAGLTHKRSRNYIEGSLLTTSSPKLSDVQLGLTSVFFAGGGFWTIDGGLSKGLSWWGVEPLPGEGTGTVPTTRWLRWQGSASYARSFKLHELDAQWSSSVQAQTSRDYLYGSEQISVGGLYTVRGFDGTSLSGDRGAYWRNDLALALPPSADPDVARWMGRLQPYVALDIGHIAGREGQVGGTLAGMVLGLRNSGGQVNFDIGYGQPVWSSASVKRRGPIENHALYARVSLSF